MTLGLTLPTPDNLNVVKMLQFPAVLEAVSDGCVPRSRYNDSFPGLTAPRTPNWNKSCAKHHWMIRTQPPMTDEQALHSDALYRARWQSLLSVDDMVEGVVKQVEAMGATKKTYFIFTSDHG